MSNDAPAGDMTRTRVFGVIPAAGRSRRMGRPKQLLPYRGSTVLETVIETILGGGLDGLVVVTNPQVDKALNLTGSERHLTAILDDAEAEMLESIMLGADALHRHHRPHDSDAIMVCPGDIARVTRALVDACAAEYRKNPQSIVVGAVGDRTGHPIVVPFALRPQLEHLRGLGLKQILTTHAGRVRRVPAPSIESMSDLDTPQDYAALEE